MHSSTPEPGSDSEGKAMSVKSVMEGLSFWFAIVLLGVGLVANLSANGIVMGGYRPTVPIDWTPRHVSFNRTSANANP
jgi:hypothetical protein